MATNDLKAWARQQRAPVTLGFLAAMVLAFLVSWFTGGGLAKLFAFNPGLPWTVFTYPLGYPGNGFEFLWLLLLAFWMVQVGPMVENRFGTTRYAVFLGLMVLIPGLFAGYVATLFGARLPLYGGYLPVAGLTMVWAAWNQTAQVRFFGIIPITGKILAILTAVLILLGYGTGNPIVGVLACLHLAFAWMVGIGKVPWFTEAAAYRPSKQKLAQESAFFDEVQRRRKEREERERLRKLFEGSLNDDDRR